MLSGPNQKSMTQILTQPSYLVQKVMKGSTMQSIHIAKTRSHLVKPKEAAFMGKVECKKCPKAVWNSMTKGQQMQVEKLHEQQGIMLATKQSSTEARIFAPESQLRISSQPKKGDAKEKEGELPKEPV